MVNFMLSIQTKHVERSSIFCQIIKGKFLLNYAFTLPSFCFILNILKSMMMCTICSVHCTISRLECDMIKRKCFITHTFMIYHNNIKQKISTLVAMLFFIRLGF